MILYITVTLLTVLAACTVKGRREMQPDRGGCLLVTRQGMTDRVSIGFIFTALFLLSALRFNVGNDYWKYVEFMHLVRCDSYVPTEWGFNLLVKIIYGISGFENYKLVFAVYAFLTVMFFMAAIYEQSSSFGMSFFMFMTLGLYFQSFSTVRYYLALAMALYSIRYVRDRQWVRFLVLIALASGFHKSVLVVIPLYILAVIPWKKWMAALLMVSAVSLAVFRDFWLRLAAELYPTYKETSYISDGGTVSAANIVRCLAVILLAVYVWRVTENKNGRAVFYFKLNVIALMLYACCWYIPFVSRIGYYMSAVQILLVPELIRVYADHDKAGTASYSGSAAKGKKTRALVITAVIVCILYFALYLKRAYQPGIGVLPYGTYLFQDNITIVQDVS